MFDQVFELHDLAVVLLLVVLEGVLSIDNALVLGLLARRLPRNQQSRALTYGLVGAFVFRLIAIATATYLLRWWFIKLLGGGYLLYVAIKHLFFERQTHAAHVDAAGQPVLIDERTGQPLPEEEQLQEIRQRAHTPMPPSVVRGKARFWPTVLVIEMTDIAFAVDSILAAIALVGSAPADHHGLHPKLWVVLTGGFLGVVLMRLAAVVFIRLLERFPRLELSAYLLVLSIGAKLLADWWFNKPPANLPPGKAFHGPLDFHSPASPAFWVFWGLMLLCFTVGFIPRKPHADTETR
jgi:YkoY family integral membrane protein